MIVHFTSSQDWISRIIKRLSMSKWSHTALQIGPSIFEATMRDGVTVTSLQEFRARYPESDTIKLSDGNKDIVSTWLRMQIGKDYDYTGLVAFPTQRNWEDTEKWFCSELIAEALIKGGIVHPKIKSNRITPRDLYLLLSYGDVDHD